MGLLPDWVGGAVGGILGPVGAVLGGGNLAADALTGGAVSNAKSVEATNAAQIGLAREQTAFQERMSNSAYQRAVEDMRKAGLNPSLAYQNGGASAPTGSMATLTAPRKGDIGAGLFNTAKAIATGSADIRKANSETDLNKMNAQVADVSAQKITANAKESEANTEYTQQLLKKAEADTRAARANADMREAEVPAAKKQSEYDSKAAPYDAILKRVREVLGTASSARRLLPR